MKVSKQEYINRINGHRDQIVADIKEYGYAFSDNLFEEIKQCAGAHYAWAREGWRCVYYHSENTGRAIDQAYRKSNYLDIAEDIARGDVCIALMAHFEIPLDRNVYDPHNNIA